MTQSRRIVMRQLTLSWAQPRASGAGGGESGADTAKQQQPRGSRKRRRSEPPGAKRSLLAFFNGDRPGAQSARPADPQAGSPDRSDSRPAADPEAPGAGDAGEEEDSIAPLLAPSVPASPPAPTPPEPSTSSSVQDYQQARSERLRRNAEMLAQLGLKPLSAELGAATAPNPTKRKPRASKRERARAIAEALPRRRSLRRAAKDGPAAAADAPAGGVEGAEANTEAAEESDGEKPEDYGASHILSYECGEDSEQRLAPAPEANELFLGVAPWPGGPRRFDDPQLKRVYTMDMCPAGRLLAAAGHGGRAAVFVVRGQAEEEAPAASWRAHRGWISCVRCLQFPGLSASLLLSSANDGSAVVWDLSRAKQEGSRRQLGQPFPLAQCDDLHGGSGIFDLTVAGPHFASAAKDGSVVFGGLDPSGRLSRVRQWGDAHGGVVKAASLHPDGRLIATAGNDCAVRVFDVRTTGSAAACSIEEAHPLAINGTAWRPGSEHLVLSSGFDPALRVHDLRRPDQPLHLLRGHVAPGQARCKGINRPVVVAGPAGPTVLTGGSKSDFLSVYSMDTGAVLSRGHVGFEPSALLAGPAEPASLVAAAHSGVVELFQPRWGSPPQAEAHGGHSPPSPPEAE